MANHVGKIHGRMELKIEKPSDWSYLQMYFHSSANVRSQSYTTSVSAAAAVHFTCYVNGCLHSQTHAPRDSLSS
jgi:hypothetical protein